MVVLTADDGIRGVRPRDVQRQPADRARCRQGPARRPRRRDRRSTAPPSSSPIIDAGDEAELQALERLMTRIGNWPPVVAVTQSFDESRRAPPDADAGGRFPGQAGAAGRTGAHLRARRQAAGQRATTDRSADLHLSAGRRRRRRDHARGADRHAAAQQRRARQDRDLPGRSRFPARRLRRLSRHRAAPQSRARSSRARSGSTGNCSKSCCRSIRPASP